ncbi:DNA-binding transcriptional regulator, AcrR family [Sinosporangium album]|uniref:DNA-binding transcriptional regulator, AcrR family n=1 Tax=Sinosporangium album TaxID=504805 RepID=A0A1G8KEX8_9ACTN|nr:TetR family transcriptional regulator [Sinosporangium album]SDI41967.1 DNA-binding transcriptional regulator, AcrR family [Sinosporangium album]
MATQISLRERKKQQTRDALVDTALALFTERGFDGVTLDELCETVEVSKRTFFRNFSSKEEVASAPLEAMWRLFLDTMETLPLDRAPVLDLLRDTLLAVLDQMAEDERWVGRVRLNQRLTERTPSITAHGLHFCARTSAEVETTLHRRLGLDSRDPRLRLVLEMAVAAFHAALRAWIAEPGRPSHAALTAEVRTAFAAIPAAITLSAAPSTREVSP